MPLCQQRHAADNCFPVLLNRVLPSHAGYVVETVKVRGLAIGR